MVRNIMAFQSTSAQRNALFLQDYEKQVDIGDCLHLIAVSNHNWKMANLHSAMAPDV